MSRTQACVIPALRFVWIRCRQSCSLLHLSFFVLTQIKDWRQFKSEAYKGHLIPTPVCTGIQGLACIFLNIISFHPQYICFTVSSYFAQGYRDLNAVLWTKLETGPRFANIWTLAEFNFFIEFPPPNFDHKIFCLSIFCSIFFCPLSYRVCSLSVSASNLIYCKFNSCCVFRPANGCSAHRSLVEIDFLTLKQLFPSLTEQINKKGPKDVIENYRPISNINAFKHKKNWRKASQNHAKHVVNKGEQSV